MDRKISYLILGLSFIWILGGCVHTAEVGKIDADSLNGVWADKGQKYIYAFLENGKFKFWVFRDRPEKTQGVWKMNECESGDQFGDLLIYTDKVQCCASAQISGNKLILKKVWMQAYWVDALNVCSDKVLTKIEKMPPE